jgi:hypothetical protein
MQLRPAAMVLALYCQTNVLLTPAEVQWNHLSSQKGDLPLPGESTQQTASLVLDVDKDGVNDFILGFRQKPPALLWYRRITNGWSRYVIEKEYLTIEAGGAFYDIDGDGDLDIVFGGDWQSHELWWWENPYPSFDPNVSWQRHLIKRSGATQHHDQIFGDFQGTGKPQLAFWNQGAKTLFLASIPPNPREAQTWIYTNIFSGIAGEGAAQYAEGMAAYDIDGDGKLDLLAGNYWFKRMDGNGFTPVTCATMGGRIKAGRLKPGRYAQIVVAPGDGVGPLTWYECIGDPTKATNWQGHVLLPQMVHGHSLELGDIDQDGHLDIFCAEMAKWTEKKIVPDNPDAIVWIFYGDGRGNFRKTELATHYGTHEARLADLDGDGDLDILDKPYNWEAPRVDVWLNQLHGKK